MAPAPDLTRAWLEEGTALFLKAFESLDDEALAAPGTLPGWTGRHLVAHVAANADALANLARWARTGEETPMYASAAQRDADIEAGSRQPATQLRHWVASSAARLADSLDTLTAEQWTHEVRTAQGRTVPATEIPWLRSREVMVHAVDLGGAVTFADLPSAFDAALLDEITARRSAGAEGPAVALAPTDDERTWAVAGAGHPTTVRGPLAQLTAYLSGRPATGLLADGGAVPTLPRWL
ncbi:maleylpyruvate isomerase [Intrasporangium oryzae NRRL B-24470]|uniref:Maleylpyruvate isomerase n=1 Tax=Intrasporangium oryzae NRRL B-24470 TaxID=1386089 RepID=W9G663_9MICO|nr:maleylpyruvate isomerase family mycothiol-dependent enzyme [Intrasporangium oryzae]EWT00293.1 maleylpyruvate isomerase [Intrasporangium oryzae NRRL B-24470]